MVSHCFAPAAALSNRRSLAHIDAIVSARLGPTRGAGKSQPACFNRQIAMYLASRMGRWSTTVIGRFYGGRDHSTVLHAIQRIEALCEENSEVDVLISELKAKLVPADGSREQEKKLSQVSHDDLEVLADLIVNRLRR
jgi:Bacterial dnaA protein helix-turn-helix